MFSAEYGVSGLLDTIKKSTALIIALAQVISYLVGCSDLWTFFTYPENTLPLLPVYPRVIDTWSPTSNELDKQVIVADEVGAE
jgi:P2-related tail formation protein